MRNSVFLAFILCLMLVISACGQKSETGKLAEKSDTKSEQVKRDKPIEVGETAPDFSLTTTNDEKITLSEINKSTMLVFYRGHW